MKAIIFDLDGVIVSTDDFHYKAWKKMADKENIYFDETINDRLRGISRMASLDIILEKADKTYTEDEKVALATYKNEIYRELLKDIYVTHILPGVMDVLHALKAKGYKLAIGSSSRNAKLILKRIALFEYFDAISDGTNITKSKPDPEVFLVAADKLNISPNDCLVVEDAISGIEAADRAGMQSFAVGDAVRSPLATYQSNDIRDLLKFV